MRKKFKRKAVRQLIPTLFFVTSCSAAGEFVGEISGKSSEESVILTMTLTNKKEYAVCIENWPKSSVEIQDFMYGDAFILESVGGEPSVYKGSVVDVSNNSNKSYYVVSPGESLKAKYNLARLYDLGKSKYTVSYYLSVADCKVFDEEVPYFWTPVNLKGIASVEGLDFDRLKNRLYRDGKGYMSIYRMDVVEFEVE